MDETWTHMMETLKLVCNTDYSMVKHDILMHYGKPEIVRTWELYNWLETQMKSDNKRIQNTLMTFIQSEECHQFMMGFILSGFAENLNKVYGLHLSTLVVEISKNIAGERRLLNMLKLQRFNGMVAPFIPPKQNDVKEDAKIQMDYNIADFNYRMVICKHQGHREREEINKRFGSVNHQFKTCNGIMMHIYPRKAWHEFVNSPLFVSFKCKTDNNYVCFIVKHLLKLIEYATDIYRLRPKINMYVAYHDNNYENKEYEMMHNTDRILWQNFKHCPQYLNFVSLCNDDAKIKDMFDMEYEPETTKFTQQKRKKMEIKVNDIKKMKMKECIETMLPTEDTIHIDEFLPTIIPCERILHHVVENEYAVIDTIKDLLFEDQIRDILLNV